MSSVEMKNFTNMFCRLIGSLRDNEFICHEFMADAMQIKDSFHRMSTINSATDPDLLIDDDEVVRLQTENLEMKNLLADYHRGVELLMGAYRERVLNNMLLQENETSSTAGLTCSELFDPRLFETIIEQSEEIYEMLNTMRRACNVDADSEYLITEQVAFLRKENEILKELYEASKRFGTAQNRLRFNELSLKETGVQTDLEVKTKNAEKPGCSEQSLPHSYSDKYWEDYEQWKLKQARENNVVVESEDEDEITVVDFQTHNESKAQKIDKKSVSSQAYTF